MKIAVKDIEPNPYRHIERYPIDNAKVQQLRRSIQTTGFWNNILARPHPTRKGKFQLGYGHHRLMAIKEEKIKQVDIPVQDLDDATMLRVMAEENLNWSSSTQVINETILAAKEFLDAELAKYETWEEAQADKFISLAFSRSKDFVTARKSGVGRVVLLKFLGNNWKDWMIQGAIDTFTQDAAGVVDRQAVETFERPGQANNFRKSIQALSESRKKRISRKEQRQIAKEVREELERKELKGGEIGARAADKAGRTLPVKRNGQFKMLDDYLSVTCGRIEAVRERLERMKGCLENVQKDVLLADLTFQCEESQKVMASIVKEIKDVGRKVRSA